MSHQDVTAESPTAIPRYVQAFARNVAQRGDALELLRSLPDACAALAFFDPQHRGVLDKLAFGNEGARHGEPTGGPAAGRSSTGRGRPAAPRAHAEAALGARAVRRSAPRHGAAAARCLARCLAGADR